MSRAKPYQARSDASESAMELSSFDKNDAVPDTPHSHSLSAQLPTGSPALENAISVRRGRRASR